MKELRIKLKSLYDDFVTRYGKLNTARNKRIILKDDTGYLIASSLEVKTGHNEYTPSDYLTRANDGQAEEYHTDSAIDGLSYCLGQYGCVRMDIIAKVVDRDEEELIHELGDLIYLNPATGNFETADKYLSGNVYEKMMMAAQVVTEAHSDQVERSYRAIKEVQPDKIPWDLLDYQLGERWVPVNIYTQFCQHLFEYNAVEVIYFPSTDQYKVKIGNRWACSKMTREYKVTPKGARNNTMYGDELFEHAMSNTSPRFTFTNSLGEKEVDSDAVQLANDKIDTMRMLFIEWLQTISQEDKDMLVDSYNNLYNCYVLRKYDGSHLTFPNLDLSKLGQKGEPTELYNSQVNAIWRIIQDCGAIIDHQVGSGKTLIQVISAYEMKRMGIRRKPAILCLKANIADVVKTYRLAYPSAKILAPAEADFEKKNRNRLFHEIKNNDWDAVIMTHDQFGKIPQSAEIQQEILQDEIDNLERDLDVIEDQGYNISRIMKKGLEQRKSTLEVKLKEQKARIASGKDRGIEFSDMNIDHLFIDESHRFKNLCFTTRHDRVAGLGNTQGSQKALNMLFAIRTLQKRFDSDLQVTFLSGTPISNSLTEMYLLFKYLRPRELARQQIFNFDAWAAVFAKKTTDFEFSVTNQIQSKERFRHFIKVPELALFYNEIADYRTNHSIGIDLPEMVEELVPLTPTPDQVDFIQRLINFAKTGIGEYIFRPPLSKAEDNARMLIATNYAKKMSTDMRLIDPVMYDDHPDNKISVCCRKVKEFYDRFHDDKGVQLIFCDLGVPDKSKWNVYYEIRRKLTEDHLIPIEEIAFIHDYNERTRSKLFASVNAGNIRVLLGSTDKAGTGVNVQQRVIAIHDIDIPWKPAELEQRGGRGARQGNWLAKLKQDNKVYRFIYAVERSLDTYKFTLLKNKQTFISQMKTNELQVRSIDEGSFDEANGMNFAEYIAILSGDTTLLEKAKVDKKLAVLENLRKVHYREQHSNKYLLDHKISRLEEVEETLVLVQRDADLYEKNMTRDETGTKNNPIVIPALSETLNALEVQRCQAAAEKARIKEERRWKRENAKATKRAIQEGYQVEDVEDVPDEVEEKEVPDTIEEDSTVIGRHLINLWLRWRPKVGEVKECIGELLGFKLYIERINDIDSYSSITGSNAIQNNALYAQHPDGGLKYKFNQGIPNRDNLKSAARNFLNGIDRSLTILAQYKDEERGLRRDIEQLSGIENKPFSKEDEIKALYEESERLEIEIEAKIRGGQMSGSQAQAASVVPDEEESVPWEDAEVEEVTECETTLPVRQHNHPRPWRKGR